MMQAASADAAGPAAPNAAVVRVSAKALRAAVACELCGGIPRDPHVSTLCMHSACYECFAKHWEWDGRNNRCPLCTAEGVTTLWGAHPVAGKGGGVPKLQRDYSMVSLLRKLYPRPDVDAEIEERQRIEILTAASLRKPLDKADKAKPALSYEECVPFLALRAGAAPDAEPAVELLRPYVAAPWAATVSGVCTYLAERLRAEALGGGGLALYCHGRRLADDDTLLYVYHHCWLPAAGSMDVMRLHYRDVG